MWQRGGACGRPGLAAPGGARRPGAGRGRPRAGARVVAASLGRRRLLRAGAERPAVAGGPRSGRDGARRRRTGGTSAPPAANQSLASLPAWGLFPRETVYPSCLCWEWPLACVSPWTWPSTSRAVSLHAPGRVLTSLDAHGTLLGWTGCTSSRGCQNQGRRLDLRKALSPHSKGRGPAMTPGDTSPKQHWCLLGSHKPTVIPGPHWCAERCVLCAREPPRGEEGGLSLRCSRDCCLLVLFWVFHLPCICDLRGYGWDGRPLHSRAVCGGKGCCQNFGLLL